MPASRRFRQGVGVARQLAASRLDEVPRRSRGGSRLDAIDVFVGLGVEAERRLATGSLSAEVRQRLASARDAALRAVREGDGRAAEVAALDRRLRAALQAPDVRRVNGSRRPSPRSRPGTDRLAGAFVPAWETRRT